jgi:hypothetical protein
MQATQAALLAAIATKRPDPKDLIGKKNRIPSGPDEIPTPGVSRLGFSGVMRGLANKGLVVCYPGPSVSLTVKGVKAYLESNASAPAPEPAPAPAPAPTPKGKAPRTPAPTPATVAELSPAQKAWVTRRATAAAKAAEASTPAPAPKGKPPRAPAPTPAAGGELSPAQKAWVTRRAMAAAKGKAPAPV